MKTVMPTFESLMKSPKNMVVTGSPVPKSPMFVARKSSVTLENKQMKTPVVPKDDVNGDEIQKDIDRNEYPQSLCERIVQKVVSLFYSSKHLLVLTLLQSSSKAMTIDEISQMTGRSLGPSIIGPCLDDLAFDYLVSRVALSEGTSTTRSTRGKKRLFNYKYYIDYKIAIEVIVYKVCRLQVANQTTTGKTGSMKYFCHCNPSVQYGYFEAMEFFSDGVFYCPDCDGEMEVVEEAQEMRKETGNTGFMTIRSLKEDLACLKKEYFDVLDYPKVTLGNEENHVSETPGMKGLNRRQKETGKDEKKMKIYSNQRMPWEDSEDEIIEETPVVEESGYEIDLDSLPYGEFRFLEPNKTFVDNVETICTSPERPNSEVILVKPRRGVKTVRNVTRRPIMTFMK